MECCSLVINPYLSNEQMYYHALLFKMQVLRILRQHAPGHRKSTRPLETRDLCSRFLSKNRIKPTHDPMSQVNSVQFTSTYSSVFHKFPSAFLSNCHKNKKHHKKLLQFIDIQFILYLTSSYSLTTTPISRLIEFVIVAAL